MADALGSLVVRHQAIGHFGLRSPATLTLHPLGTNKPARGRLFGNQLILLVLDTGFEPVTFGFGAQLE